MASDPLFDAAKNNDFTTFRAEWCTMYGLTPTGLSTAEEQAIAVAFNSYRSVATSSNRGNSAANTDLSLSGIVMGALRTQTGGDAGRGGEFTGIEDALNLFYDTANKRWRNIWTLEPVKEFTELIVGNINLYFEELSDLQEQINENTSLTGEMSRNFREEIMRASVYGNRLGISFDDIGKGMSQLITEAGRFKLISESTINSISLQSKVFFDGFDQAVGSIDEFQKVSRGAEDAMAAVEKAGKGTLELGINAKETVGTMVTNLEKLNQFGFKNGIEGLTRMVQKAQILKLDLGAAFKLAEDVMDPTKALSVAANLQVIGGAIGDLNDPIRMMWMATNNVEGLQDALAESAESLATFNKESGAFEVVGADLRRARAMADSLGMKFEDITNLAVQAAQRTSAAADLMSTGLTLKEEDREFLTNVAQMKGGKMVIETTSKDGESISVALESMTKEQAEYLLSQKEQFKEMSTMDIARTQVNAIKNIERDMSYLVASARLQVGRFINKELIQSTLGFDPNTAANLTKEFTDQAQKSILSMASSGNEAFEKMLSTTKETKPETVPSPQVPITTTSNVNLTITGNSNFDSLMKEMLKDPKMTQEAIRSFLNYTPTNS